MPVPMPAYAFAGIGLLPDMGVVAARSEGGLVITSRHTDPFWRGTLRTVKLEPWTGQGKNQHAAFLAFLSRCVDENLRVDFTHPRHRYPSYYTAANWPLATDATLAATPDARTLGVQGLSLGLVLKAGDRIAALQGGVVVHRWIAEDLVVASTINQAVKVTPRLPLGVLLPGATVKLKDPPLRLAIVPGSWSAEEAKEPTAVSFEVEEALR